MVVFTGGFTEIREVLDDVNTVFWVMSKIYRITYVFSLISDNPSVDKVYTILLSSFALYIWWQNISKTIIK